MFENKVLGNIFRATSDETARDWRKVHNVELCALYSSPNIIRNLRSIGLGWAGHVERMKETINANKRFSGKT